MTLDEVSEEIQKKLRYAERLHEKILFDFGEDGMVFLDAGQSPPVLSQGAGENPDVTFSLSLGTFEKILKGEEDPSLAFMMGKMKINGSMGVALKLSAALES